MFRTIRTAALEIGYEESGPDDGPPVILLHGWPSDPHDWDGVAPALAAEGCHVLAPWLRGYGPTRFLHRDTPRSGQQAALGADLRDFMDALGIEDAFLAGYDWGGRAACVVAALWPERVRGLVSIGGYNIQNIACRPIRPRRRRNIGCGTSGISRPSAAAPGSRQNRRDVARLLWRLWSPNWQFDDATFEATAASFDNPDFVAVTIQSYRHRHGNAAGDPALEPIEQRLAAQPAISVPTIVLHGAADGVSPAGQSERDARPFRRPLRPPRHPGRRPFPVARNPARGGSGIARPDRGPG